MLGQPKYQEGRFSRLLISNKLLSINYHFKLYIKYENRLLVTSNLGGDKPKIDLTLEIIIWMIKLLLVDTKICLLIVNITLLKCNI